MQTSGTPARVRSGRRLSVPTWLLLVAIAAQGVLTVELALQWLYVGTRRLYLGQEAAGPGTARQRFDVVGARVQPEIVAADDGRIAFPVALQLPARLRVRAVAKAPATVEVASVEDGSRRALAHAAVQGTAEIDVPVPARTRAIELANDGAVRWVDARLVDAPGYGRLLAWLCGLGALALLWRLRAGDALPAVGRARTAVLGGVTLGISTAVCLVVLELSLRALGPRLPSWIAVERRNLGEVRADPRWQDSKDYGPRLAPLVSTACQWQHGDIVRMGFLSPDLVRHAAYRFPLVTDAEGFRNATPPSPVEIAALGDSFTDALTLPAELTWPARLGERLGASVRNYGTAGFGPGQERRVLAEYALPRRPRLVVVGFFAGNDLQDAERFETFERTGSFPGGSALGWKFKEVIARFDELYVMSLFQAAGARVALGHVAPDVHADAGPADYSGEDPDALPVPRASFDRGLFAVPVSGRTVRFAFLPPYLNCLQLSRAELEGSPGWNATLRSYREMKRLAEAQGARLAVVFIPSKAQVYLPLVEASFTRPELERAVAVSLRDLPHPPAAERLLQNRLALNGLMRAFCASEGIPFLDLTDALQARLATGTNVYFPDDSHWNAAGHETAAAAIAPFLALETERARP
jgi:lysophospholipase L1-like esterase